MDERLLRAKMALKGDYDVVCLTLVTGLSIQAINQRLKNEVPWKQPEIKAIASKYGFTDAEITQTFDLME